MTYGFSISLECIIARKKITDRQAEIVLHQQESNSKLQLILN